MRKRGFTLAELLIVLGIAGVVAAVILPAINGLMPDKTKINYLKVYDELGKNIKALTSDSSIFPVVIKEGSTDIDVSKYPLVNNSQPLKAPFKDDTKYSGDNKLCNLLAHTFGADSCNTTSYPDKSSFTTSNGMEWWISQTKREIDTASNKIAYQADIYVDVDSSKKSSNCMYGEDGCKQPDRFKFLLAADGRLVPADPVGVHYINTRKNLLKKKFKVEGNVLASLDDVDFKNIHSDNLVTDNNEPIDNDVNDNTGDNNQNEPEGEVMGDPEDEYAMCGKTYYDGSSKVFINCVSEKKSSDGKTILQSERPVASNFYLLYKYRFSENRHDIAFRLCLLPYGYSEAECSGKNVFYRYYNAEYNKKYPLGSFDEHMTNGDSTSVLVTWHMPYQIITSRYSYYDRYTGIPCGNQRLRNSNPISAKYVRFSEYDTWFIGATAGGIGGSSWVNGLGHECGYIDDIIKLGGYCSLQGY